MDPNAPVPQVENVAPAPVPEPVAPPAPEPVTPPTMPNPPVDQPPAPPPAPQTPPELVKKTSPIFTVALILLLLTILILGGYYVWTNYLGGHLGDRNNVSVTASPVTLATPIPTTDPTASWKTYTNLEYGFSFKYPPSLNVSAPTDTLNKGHISVGNVLAFFFGSRRTNELASIANSGQKVFEPTELPTLQMVGQSFNITKSVLSEGFPGDTRFPGCENTTTSNTYFFDVQNKMLVYINSVGTTGCDQQGNKTETNSFEENVALASQILSTFKFTEASTSATSSPSATP